MTKRVGPPRPTRYISFTPISGLISLLLFYFLFIKLFPTQFPKFIIFSGIPVPANNITIIFIDLFLIFLLLPLAFYSKKYTVFMQKLKEQTRGFLQVYPSVATSLPSVSQAIIASIDLVEEPLKDYLAAFGYLYKMTGDLEGSFLKIFSNAPRDVRLLLISILTTAKSGGRSSDVLNVTSKYASELQRMESYLKNKLQSYSTVIMMGIAVYGFSVGMTTVMLEILRKSPSLGLTGISTYAINVEGVIGIFFYSLLIVSAASAYVIAKIISDYAPRTSEYFIYLISIGTISMMIAFSMARGLIH
ncbi:MAG: hypothetical protein C0172_02970 [Caldisphaera sp.]|nr:MAG: hypothetical protein C0172_02970 [Caldisphaera sp.]